MRHNLKLEIEEDDLEFLKGRILSGANMTIAPFSPLLVFSSVPITIIFLVFSIYDFFLSRPTQLCRKYVQGFENLYLVIFVTCLSLRVALEFVDNIFWGIPLFLGPTTYLFWMRYSLRNWQFLYDNSQKMEEGTHADA
ncbi:MAG: hypothetical protein COA71_12740 [SAR86 cluster bacterium]|uniref:Uncharacterized protein n=1 Tax=SAR86 cluster bacterium TaxID=2030880 RepID=A0A2A5C838_9GAMM|nr:MAG: hypothetical protein COA71_12740 [SAR86 cluster bacterium]